jgi:hypothetical protein
MIGCKLIPVVLGLQEVLKLWFVGKIYEFFLDSLADSSLKRTGKGFNLNQRTITLFFLLGVSAWQGMPEV